MMRTWLRFWQIIQWEAVLLVFFTGSWWWRPHWLREAAWLPDWLQDADLRLSALHYGFMPLVGLALIGWGLRGFPGLGRLGGSLSIFWIMLIFQLAIWALITIPPDALNRDVALSGGLSLLIAAVFALVILADSPPPGWIAAALIGGVLFQALIGIGQTALQTELNIHKIDAWLGEPLELWEPFLDPQKSGTSVVQADGVRYLRPYGVSAHPNTLSGLMVMGLCAALGWWWAARDRRWLALVMVIGGWALLLTFSRSALGALAVGGALTTILSVITTRKTRAFAWRSWRIHHPFHQENRERLAGLIGLGLLVMGVFGLIYQPVLAVRFGLGDEGGGQSVEALSIEARVVYREQALDLIRENPLRGVGIGNFAWHSARLLANDWRDLQGDHVHNIYLLALAEVGMIGLSLYLGAILFASLTVIGRSWRGAIHPIQIGLWGGAMAWLAFGWFDHYPWTQAGYLLLFWGALAGALVTPANLAISHIQLPLPNRWLDDAVPE